MTVPVTDICLNVLKPFWRGFRAAASARATHIPAAIAFYILMPVSPKGLKFLSVRGSHKIFYMANGKCHFQRHFCPPRHFRRRAGIEKREKKLPVVAR